MTILRTILECLGILYCFYSTMLTLYVAIPTQKRLFPGSPWYRLVFCFVMNFLFWPAAIFFQEEGKEGPEGK